MELSNTKAPRQNIFAKQNQLGLSKAWKIGECFNTIYFFQLMTFQRQCTQASLRAHFSVQDGLTLLHYSSIFCAGRIALWISSHSEEHCASWKVHVQFEVIKICMTVHIYFCRLHFRTRTILKEGPNIPIEYPHFPQIILLQVESCRNSDISIANTNSPVIESMVLSQTIDSFSIILKNCTTLILYLPMKYIYTKQLFCLLPISWP